MQHIAERVVPVHPWSANAVSAIHLDNLNAVYGVSICLFTIRSILLQEEQTTYSCREARKRKLEGEIAGCRNGEPSYRQLAHFSRK